MTSYIFIPGAWLGAWSWYPVAKRLHARGHDVLPLTLPGLAQGDDPTGLRLDDAVEFIVDRVRSHGSAPVTLVCHSWGGYPATGAAHVLGDSVGEVIYYNAVVPLAGHGMRDENEAHASAIDEAMLARPDQTIPLPFEAIVHGMMQDESAELHRLVFDMTVPQPGGYMVDSLSTGSVTEAGISARYLLGSNDISLARPGSEFAARLGREVIMVEGSHLAMLSQPEAIAEAISSRTD